MLVLLSIDSGILESAYEERLVRSSGRVIGGYDKALLVSATPHGYTLNTWTATLHPKPERQDCVIAWLADAAGSLGPRGCI